MARSLIGLVNQLDWGSEEVVDTRAQGRAWPLSHRATGAEAQADHHIATV